MTLLSQPGILIASLPEGKTPKSIVFGIAKQEYCPIRSCNSNNESICSAGTAANGVAHDALCNASSTALHVEALTASRAEPTNGSSSQTQSQVVKSSV